MSEELERSMKELKLENEEPPYFISYTIHDEKRLLIKSKYGGIIHSYIVHSRPFDVEVRVGDYKFDNTEHPSEARYSDVYYDSPEEWMSMPLDDDISAIRRALWLATDFKYRFALRQMLSKKARLVTEPETRKVDNFSRCSTEVYVEEIKHIDLEEIKTEFEKKCQEFSAIFKHYPEILDSGVSFSVRLRSKYFVNSEGTKLQMSKILFHMSITASTLADDGMKLWSYRDFFSFSRDEFPGDEKVKYEINDLISELIKLRKAPVMEPYSAPAIIKSPASGVFFHEVLGHRLEGHRQLSEKEGETFKDKVGKRILPAFLNVVDDPTLKYYKDEPLIGHYKFDDEGVKARKVVLIKNGVLQNFLMSRMPIENFYHSTGHGRKEITGHYYHIPVVPRQANFIIESEKSYPYKHLKKMLIEECKKRNKPYGLIFTHSYAGGTHTGRFWIQSFLQKPLIIYRVDVKTGKEELVRGVEFGGTPLVCIDKIIACGDDHKVFNGSCNAESGMIELALVAPSVLLSEIEIQKSPIERHRPPLISPPWGLD